MTPFTISRLACVGLLFSAAQQASATDWPAGYSKCADEGGTCKVGTTPRQVSFGIDGNWVLKTLSGDQHCTLATFGTDPAPAETKKCAVIKVATPAPAPSPAPSPAPTPSPAPDDTRASAPPTGWAGTAGGTDGGAKATASAVVIVGTASDLAAAVHASGSAPRIVKVVGRIDMTAADNGGAFRSTKDQAARGELKLPANTTLVGVGANATLLNASLMIKGVDNVIVRNLTLVNPCDVAPVWDSSDGASGNWNSEFDGVTIDGAHHVWIDHDRFTDTPQTDDLSPVVHGKVEQCHDGAVDIKNAADYVTVSYNVFDHHDKNDLIGSSDSTATDDGHLSVTFNDNWFAAVTQRAPRVRFGKVHVYDNLYSGSKADAVYPHAYSIGVGYKAKVISEQNVFEVAGASGCPSVIDNPGSSSKAGAIVDSGSLLNGAALVMAQCAMSASVGWTVPYDYRSRLRAASTVKAWVQAQAGVGKLNVPR
jgi:pectate lyase